MPTVAIMTVWKNFGVTMTILLTAIQGISPSLYESAQMDGATNRQQFFNITLPQIVPSLGFCILTNLIGSMQVFDQVYVATAGGHNLRQKQLFNIFTVEDLQHLMNWAMHQHCLRFCLSLLQL